MGKASGLAEPAVRKIIDCFQDAIPLHVDRRAGDEHETLYAFLREYVRSHATGCARSDDENVVGRFFLYLHGGSFTRSATNRCSARLRCAAPRIWPGPTHEN